MVMKVKALLKQSARAFHTIGCAVYIIWRQIGEPVYSELDSPTNLGETIDTKLLAIIGTSTDDDQFDMTETVGRKSSGTKIFHIKPDCSLAREERILLAGDEFYRYADEELLLIQDDHSFIKPEAINITITIHSPGTVRRLTETTEYTYDAISGKVTFITPIEEDAGILASYYYDKYVVEKVNNYGRTYIEVLATKISRN